jgi:hypothetical protein
MRPADIATRVGAFVLIAVVVTAAIVGSGMVAGGGNSFSAEEMTVDGHSSVELASQPAEEGEIDLSSSTSGKVVVIDEAHGNDFGEVQIRPLVNALTENGHEVRFYQPERGPSGQALNATLRGADAFVSLAPDNRFTSNEADSVEAFLDADGRVLAAGEPEGSSLGASIFGITMSTGGGATTAEFAPALSPHGLTVGSGYLYDMTENVNNHANVYATPSADSDLTAGVGEVVVHEATPVTGGDVLLRTAASSELSTTRDASEYGVLARSGNLAVLGDASILDPDWVTVADNEVLVGNLLDYLVTGDREPMPETGGSQPGPGTAPRP